VRAPLTGFAQIEAGQPLVEMDLATADVAAKKILAHMVMSFILSVNKYSNLRDNKNSEIIKTLNHQINQTQTQTQTKT
jgi:serine phosphatase RsbU (regulator of sigma subunit)